MPRERLNGKRKKNLFLKFTYRNFFLISNSFLAFVWLPRKWRKQFMTAPLKLGHIHIYIYNMIGKTH